MKYAWVFLLLAGCVTGLFASIPEETGTVEAFFCDQVDCTQIFAQKVSNAVSVDCALYHSSKAINSILNSKNVRIVVDEAHPVKGAVKEKGAGYMHNKFCIIDGQYVWTGSWNPAQEKTIPNNVILIQSSALAKAYQAEFDELTGGTFHGGKPLPGRVKFNGQLAEAYFCPEDDCKKRVLDVLETAKQSIHFMMYSFTDDEIGDFLVKKKKQGLDIKGIFRSANDLGGEYPKLKAFSKTRNVHHKVFIVDGNTVITGSYNPSKRGNELNDENVIIIRDSQIAQQFENEFTHLFD